MPSREFRSDGFGTGGRIPSRVAVRFAALLGLAMLPAGCDFSRAPGQSAWGGDSPWYGDAPTQTASVPARPVPPRALPPPPPPPPRAAPGTSAGSVDLTTARPVAPAVPPPQPAPLPPPAVLPEPVPLTAPSGHPPAPLPPVYATGPRVAAVEPSMPERVAEPPTVAPVREAGMPMDPIIVDAPHADAAYLGVRPEETVRMRGQLMRSFGTLGRVELFDGIILTRAGSGTPIAWCAYAGNPAMTIVTAEGVCLFDRDGDGMFDTMAVLDRPELGYMQMGPFPYMAQQ